MTSFVGRFVKTFSEANSAMAIDVHMNGDYHFFFEIASVDPKTVMLKSLKDGSIWERKIIRRSEREWVTYDHSGVFQKTFRAKPERIKVVPFFRTNAD